MLFTNIDKLEKVKITQNPDLYKKNFISDFKLGNCVMFSYSELRPRKKTTIFKHKDILKFYLVLSGKSTIIINNKKFNIKKNDIVLIEKNEKYFLINNTSLIMKHIYAGFVY